MCYMTGSVFQSQQEFPIFSRSVIQDSYFQTETMDISMLIQTTKKNPKGETKQDVFISHTNQSSVLSWLEKH